MKADYLCLIYRGIPQGKYNRNHKYGKFK